MKMGKLISRKLFLETEDSQRDPPGMLPVTDTATTIRTDQALSHPTADKTVSWFQLG